MPIWVGVPALVIAAVSMVIGLYLEYVALRRYASASAPKGPTLNPRKWRPVWRCADWFTEPHGYRLFRRGDAVLTVGTLLALAVVIVRNFWG